MTSRVGPALYGEAEVSSSKAIAGRERRELAGAPTRFVCCTVLKI